VNLKIPKKKLHFWCNFSVLIGILYNRGSKVVGRLKQFNVNEVLSKAVQVFWRKGYDGTSLNDLTDEMGIQRASLYDTFESKEQLYLEALADYQRHGLELVGETLRSGETPTESLTRFLYTAVPSDESLRRGCFCVNSAVEVAPHHEGVATQLREHNRRVVESVAPYVASGQAKGEIRLNISPLDAATFLLTCLSGLHVLAKTERDPEIIRQCADRMIHALTLS
jgi:TetR/AcrR family transcriptional regulator, transcriptional repressor for nem operon